MVSLRIGLAGAGPVAQAIHLPTLARLGDHLKVVAIMDVDADLAAQVAAPLGARVAVSLEELLEPGDLDMIVIGSPDAFHASQIQAACGAGVVGIMAEKPLVVTSQELGDVAWMVEQADAALVVGAMHAYDPAWLAVKEALGEVDQQASWHVRCVCYIPQNPRFEDFAADMVRPQAPNRPVPSPQALIRGGVLGLAIHNLPHARHFIPQIDSVVAARVVEPWGYTITATGQGGTLELLARSGGTWKPDWTFEAYGPDVALSLRFPPSYVHGGSAVGEVRRGERALRFGPYPSNGYEAEWRELEAMSTVAATPRYSIQHLSDDIEYALRLADLAADAVEVSGAGAVIGAGEPR